MVFSEPWASVFPFGYTGINLLNIIAFRQFNRFGTCRCIQILISLLQPFLLMTALGGFLDSGAVAFWSLVAPAGAVLVTNRRDATLWFVAFAGVVVLAGVLEPIGRDGNDLAYAVVTVFFALNVLAPSSLAIVVLQYFVRQKDTAIQLFQQEQERSERLLLNVLPAAIAEILKDVTHTSTIADNFTAVSVPFADVVGSTQLTVDLSPHDMVELLNDVFSFFDTLVEKYGLEKIRTIGANYMVASGVPEPRADHAIALAGMALEMNAYVYNRQTGEGTGVVAKLGSSVTTDSHGKPIKEGDRLMYAAIVPCNRCYQCLRGEHNWCINRAGAREAGVYPYFVGTYGDYYYIGPAQPVFAVPPELPDKILGWVNCAMGTVTEGLLRADAKEGDYVVIQDPGGLGLNAVAMGKDMGAHKVIVLDRLQNRLDLAEEFGADHTINIEEWNTPEARTERVRELTEGRGANITMELVGRAELLV